MLTPDINARAVTSALKAIFELRYSPDITGSRNARS